MTRTSAHHPQGNGQVKHFNHTLQSILAKIVDANQDTWDSQLPKALFANRTAVHKTTGFTTFYLPLPIPVMLGCILPVKLHYTLLPNSNTGLTQPSLLSDSQCILPTHYPASGVGGHTTLDSTHPNTRPVRNLTIFGTKYLSCEDTRTG